MLPLYSSFEVGPNPVTTDLPSTILIQVEQGMYSLRRRLLSSSSEAESWSYGTSSILRPQTISSKDKRYVFEQSNSFLPRIKSDVVELNGTDFSENLEGRNSFETQEIFDPTLDIVMNETAKSRQSHSYHCSLCNIYVETLPEYKVHLQDWHNIGETEGKLTCFGCKKQWRTKITKRKSTYGFLCKCTNLNSQIHSNGKCESHDTDRLKVAECHRKTNEKNIDYSRWRHKKKLCFYCPLEFISLPDFILHIEGTHQDRDIRQMAHEIETMPDLKGLNWFKKPELDYQCDKEEAEEKQKSEKSAEQRTDENLNRKCEFCPQVFSHFGILLRHYKSVHDDRDYLQVQDRGVLLYITLINKLPDEMVICDVCGKEFSKERLKNHQNTHNPKAKQCLICNEMVLVNSWSSHKLKPTKGLQNYLCSLCGANFDCPNVYRGHLRVHTKDRKPKFQCSEPGCDSRFLWKKGLLRHVRKAHLKIHKDKICAVCNKSSAIMSKHKMTHSDKKKYGCSVCGHRTKRMDNIKTHMRRHGEEGKIIIETGNNEMEEEEGEDPSHIQQQWIQTS